MTKNLKQVSSELNIAISKIHYLETRGVISELPRKSNGHRFIDDKSELELKAVLNYQKAGISLDQIKLIREFWVTGNVDAMVDVLQDSRQQLVSKIDSLNEVLSYLDYKINLHKEKINMKQMDKVGFGTWMINDENVINDVIVNAINLGYSHIDTAQIYNNESQIGDAIVKSGVSRDKLFIATKVTFQNIAKYAYKSTLESLRRLKVDYIDLMYLHAHVTKEYDIAGYKQLMQAREEGLIRQIGVSNYSIEDLLAIKEEFGEYPRVNQIVVSPVSRVIDLELFCKENDIKLVGYSIIKPYYDQNPWYGKLQLTQENRVNLEQIAKDLGVGVANVLNKWAMQHGYHIIPKTEKVSRLSENLHYDFSLSEQQMNIIDNMNQLSSSKEYAEIVDSFKTRVVNEQTTLEDVMEKGLLFDKNY